MEKGRRAHRVRHHGRMEPVAGARAVRLAHRGLQPEYPGGHGNGALHQADLRGLRRAARKSRSGQRARRARGQGPRRSDAQRLFQYVWRRPGGDARLRHGRELRRVRSAQGWRRRARAAEPMMPNQ